MAGQVRTWPPNGTSPTWPTSNIERSYIIIFELGHWIFYSKGKKQKSGHVGGQATCPVFVFCFREGCRTRAAFTAQEGAEQTRMPRPAKRKREYGMEESEPFAEGPAALVRFD